MKKIILFAIFVIITNCIFAQDGAEHKITKIIPATTTVHINIGKQFNVKIDDVFQVFGKANIIHPATGQLVERDNVYIGKIKVVEVKDLTSVAEIIEQKEKFAEGNKIVKVADESQVVVEHKRPAQAEFENPKERLYSETIYTQRTKKKKVDRRPRIAEIKGEESDLLAIIDKGTKSKIKGKKIKEGKKYYLFTPVYEVSSISGEKEKIGEEYSGDVIVLNTQHDASEGSLKLHKELKIDYIKDDNFLLHFVPKTKGFESYTSLYLIGADIGVKWIPSGFKFSTIHGYRISDTYFFGLGSGMYQYIIDYNWYWNTYEILKVVPLYFHNRLYILNFNKKSKYNNISPFISFDIGTNIVYPKHFYINIPPIYLGSSVGLFKHINKSLSYSIQINYKTIPMGYKSPNNLSISIGLRY